MLIYEKKGRILKRGIHAGAKVIQDLYNYKIEHKIGETRPTHAGTDVAH